MPGGRQVVEAVHRRRPAHYTYTLDRRPDLKAYFSTVSVVPGDAANSPYRADVKFEPKEPAGLETATENMTKSSAATSKP
jgi:hypothetical protein